MWVNTHIKKYLGATHSPVTSPCPAVFAGNGLSEVHFVFFFGGIFSGLKALPAGTDDIHSRNTDKSPTFIPGRLPLHKFFAPGTLESVWFTSRLHFATEGLLSGSRSFFFSFFFLGPMELTAATLKLWRSDVSEQQIHHYYPSAPTDGLWKYRLSGRPRRLCVTAVSEFWERRSNLQTESLDFFFFFSFRITHFHLDRNQCKRFEGLGRPALNINVPVLFFFFFFCSTYLGGNNLFLWKVSSLVW